MHYGVLSTVVVQPYTICVKGSVLRLFRSLVHAQVGYTFRPRGVFVGSQSIDTICKGRIIGLVSNHCPARFIHLNQGHNLFPFVPPPSPPDP